MKYSEWKTITVGELGRIITGKTPKTGESDYFGGSIPFLTPSDNMNKKRVMNTKRTLTDKGAKSVKNCIIPSGSICVSCIGSDLGKVVMTTCESVTNQQINSIIPNEEYDSDFIYYLMCILGNKLNFVSKTSTAVPIVNKNSFSSYIVNVPDLNTQKKISSILSCIDEKIELNNKINDNLEQLLQINFEKLIIEESYELPLGRLADIAEINPARDLKRGICARYIEMANLPTRGSFPSDWTYKEYAGGIKFTNGDTIMARITPCLENGKTAYIDFLDANEIAFGSTEYIVISPKMKYCSEMFYFLARYKDFVNYAVKNMNGSSGRQRVSGETLGNYELHIPLKENVIIFANIARPIMENIKNRSLENRTLSNLRDMLLPRLMNGEVDLGTLDTKI